MGNFSFRGWTPGQADLLGDLAVTIPVIAGLFLIVEGLLISRRTIPYASPTLMHTKRGLRAAAFKTKRLWLLPVVFLVPGDMISAVRSVLAAVHIWGKCIQFCSSSCCHWIFTSGALAVSRCFYSRKLVVLSFGQAVLSLSRGSLRYGYRF